jgi:hemerythrin-like domain-containing protein
METGPKALAVIRDEHRAYSALIRSALRIAHECGPVPSRDELAAFRAVVDYIAVYPERFHHPKEDAHLFRLLRVRCPDVAPLLDTLSQEHVLGGVLAGELDRKLTECEQGRGGFAAFVECAERYAAFLRAHMQREEQEVLPLAEHVLTPGDWTTIDAAFRGHTDPVLGAAAEAEFGRMLKRIVMLAPAPLGAGRFASSR